MKSFSTRLANFQGTHISTTYTRHSEFCTFTISSQNYAGRKQKSHKIIGIKTFAIAGKARLNTENILCVQKVLNLAEIRLTIQ